MIGSPPTVREITNNLVSQYESEYNQTVPAIKLAFFRVAAKTIAAIYVGLYHLGAWTLLQQSPRTAADKDFSLFGLVFNPLASLGDRWGVAPKKKATQATLIFIFDIDPSSSGTINFGDLIRVDSTEIIYSALSTLTWTPVDTGPLYMSGRAVSDSEGGDGSGSVGNSAAGSLATFLDPIAASGLEVFSVNTPGTDEELSDVYRQRVIDRGQKQPQGGAPADYELWGEETPGIINNYPYKGGQPGTVDNFGEATEASSGSPDGYPTVAQLELMKEYIEYEDPQEDSPGLATRRPIGSFVNTLSINRTAFDVEVVGLDVDNETEVKSQIEDAVDEYLRDREPYIPGLTPLPKKDLITASAISTVIESIVAANGGYFSQINVSVGGIPLIEPVVLGQGGKAKAGLFSYIPA